MPARKAVTSKEFVDFNQENEDSSRHSAESSPNDDLRGFSNFKVRRNSRDKVTEECNKKSNISGGRTRNKQTLSAYSSWTLSSSDSDSDNSPPCKVADSKQTTISLSGYKDSAKKSKTSASRRNMASSTWCISSSSEEDYEMLPLSLTSRLKQRLQGKSNSVDSQVSSYLGSLATDSTSNSESQSGFHSNATSETSPERFSVMKRRNLDDREVVSRDNNLDNIDDGTPGPKKKKTRRSPEQIAEAKKLALLQRKEREKERAAKHQQKEEMKRLKEREKMQKLKEREEKKLGKEREMARKKAERQVQRATRPEECIKYVSTILDQRLVESQGGADILVHLQSKELKYSLTEQAIENAVTWQREILQVESQDSQSSCLSAGITEEPEVLVILQMSQFVEMVHSYKEEQYGSYSSSSPTQLRSYAMVTKDIYDGKNLTLVVIGMERYFRDVKSAQNKEYRSAVLGDDNNDGKKGKRKKKHGMTRIVSRIDVEEALVDLQLHVNCNVRFTETTTEAAELIAMFTKAVAETPFKRERDKGLFSFHVSNEWAGGVKVDKDGKGLLKVWRQQLQQFRNVSVDVSSAIVSVYPSPQLLIQAYQKCSTVKEAEKLLQDIVVRRGAGVLATTRRVGPELSRRVYLYMTGDDGDLVLHSR
ncbi:crossover junction endonuclease EME1-like isoform X2 [Ptychodera flava]|uniref:crossover junction endonuclease EME1-like isoform X2 n=1 Tax=Ptychodera flava TaxID=63121 RepID=UPI003969D8F4